MSAETLREAARLMRERATAAADSAPEPWKFVATHVEGCCGEVDHAEGWIFSSDRETAEHVASWPPLVALAVADWLEKAARDESHRHDFGRSGSIVQGHTIAALAVADAYLRSRPAPESVRHSLHCTCRECLADENARIRALMSGGSS